MSSIKGKLVRLFSHVALERATVVSAEPIGGFQRLLLRTNVRTFAAGTKIQLLLPTDDVRTYSPIASPDGMLLLGWLHAPGPGARWMANAQPGDMLPFVGPQRSLQLDAGPVVIVGDETSVAVAASFAVERPGQAYAVIQSQGLGDLRATAASVGLTQMEVVARGDTGATVEAVKARLAQAPNAAVALTGGAELIVAVREALRRAGVKSFKTKAYWIPGRTGLD
jgi:NADPH-dependent ferric siderophore reductase